MFPGAQKFIRRIIVIHHRDADSKAKWPKGFRFFSVFLFFISFFIYFYLFIFLLSLFEQRMFTATVSALMCNPLWLTGLKAPTN